MLKVRCVCEEGCCVSGGVCCVRRDVLCVEGVLCV